MTTITAKEKRHDMQRMGYATFCFLTNGIGYVSMIGGFVSPYWLQSYARIHTPFERLGLWEFCLKGFIFRTDIDMQSYFGCWWIFSKHFDKFRDFLTPWWFILIQVLMSIALFLYSLGTIILTIYLLCDIKNTKKRTLMSTIVRLISFIDGCLITTSIIIFGVQQLEPQWMPYPFLNWPSSGFGLAALSGCLSFVTTGYITVQVSIDKKIHEQNVYNFPLVNVPKEKSSTVF